MNPKPPYKKGDIVRHRAEFLRSTGWYTNVPINGQVLEAPDAVENHQLLTVEWSDSETTKILSANVEFCPRGRELTKRRRGEQCQR